MYLSNCKIITLGDGKARVTGPCVVTGKPTSVIADLGGLTRWMGGDYIQAALPELSASDREFLISGTSAEGWKQMFPDEEEDESEAPLGWDHI